MTIPNELTWLKMSDHPDEFCNGDNYLLALKVKDTNKNTIQWEFVNVYVDCDEEYFCLKQIINGEVYTYDDFYITDFEYYIKY